jgi:hypothetical protein
MDLGSRWRKTIAREMRAGAPAGQPFAPLSQLTLELRRRQSAEMVIDRDRARAAAKKLPRGKRKDAIARLIRKEQRRSIMRRFRRFRQRQQALWDFGGKLPNLVEYSTADGVRVGFIGAVFKRSDRAGARWMRRESRAWDKGERHWLHQMYGETIPFASYARPERQAVAPQQTRWSADAETTIRNSIQARIDAAAAKKVNAFLTPKVGSL